VQRSELEQALSLTAAEIDDSLLSLGLGAGALDDGIVLKRNGVIERHDEVLVALGTLPGVGDASRQVLADVHGIYQLLCQLHVRSMHSARRDTVSSEVLYCSSCTLHVHSSVMLDLWCAISYALLRAFGMVA
jgi:hypothetical protein